MYLLALSYSLVAESGNSSVMYSLQEQRLAEAQGGSVIVALDPGSVTGAYAALDATGSFVTCGDLPTTPLGGSGKLQLNSALCARLLSEIKPDLVIIERVGAFPGQGVSSSFRFGVSFGILLGIAGALHLPHLLISPAVWKKAMGLSREKDESRTLALQHYPEAAMFLERKKDHGRAEALLMCRYQFLKRQ